MVVLDVRKGNVGAPRSARTQEMKNTHDGAPPHHTIDVSRTINRQFGNKMLALNYLGSTEWSP